jgi:hypothetical protein
MESNRKAIEGRSSAPCSADEAHRHLYHPWWSVKEMEAIATLAHRHHMNPVELIRDAVGGWDQAWQIRHSARYILEDANPEKLAEACGLPLGVITAALKNILPNSQTDRPNGSV